MGKIRIFIVGLSNNKGGVESYIINLCEHLNSKEFEVVYDWPEMCIEDKKWIKPKNRHNYIKYVAFWHSFFKENKFDVIYYNTCDIVSVDMLKFAKRAGIPVRIIHSHNTDTQFKKRWFHYLTEKYNRKNIEKIATNLLACSEEAGKWMFDKSKFTVIKNGINLQTYEFNEQFREECRKSIGIKDEYLIGCVGRLVLQKNPEMSVNIMKCISEKQKNVKFVFIGDGELREKIEKRIEEKNLQDKVHMLGARNDVNKWYSALDCLIMPSLFEGLPFTLVEAQASGLPCVVSDTVSSKADLTGLVQYIGLEEGLDIWTDKILEECQMVRRDMTQQLVRAGYSITDTANQVSEIIKKELEGLDI